MTLANQVLAWAVLAGIGGVVAWTIWRTTRPGAAVEVGSVGWIEDGLSARATLENRVDHAIALEEVEVTKGGAFAATVEDDLRLPIEAEGSLSGDIRLDWTGDGPVPDVARLRVLFVFRSPGGAEMAETWIEVP